MEPRISLVTLGVTDLARSTAFYRRWLGLEPSPASQEDVTFFATAGTRLSLYPVEQLHEDALPDEPFTPRVGFGGVSLAHNCRERDEVDEVVAAAVAAGGSLVKQPTEAFWGGYSGYVADPDGHLWEVAWGAFPIGDDGHLEMP